MAVNIGPKIGVDGEAEYRRQINQIIQQSKTECLDLLYRKITEYMCIGSNQCDNLLCHCKRTA